MLTLRTGLEGPAGSIQSKQGHSTGSCKKQPALTACRGTTQRAVRSSCKTHLVDN